MPNPLITSARNAFFASGLEQTNQTAAQGSAQTSLAQQLQGSDNVPGHPTASSTEVHSPLLLEAGLGELDESMAELDALLAALNQDITELSPTAPTTQSGATALTKRPSSPVLERIAQQVATTREQRVSSSGTEAAPLALSLDDAMALLLSAEKPSSPIEKSAPAPKLNRVQQFAKDCGAVEVKPFHQMDKAHRFQRAICASLAETYMVCRHEGKDLFVERDGKLALDEVQRRRVVELAQAFYREPVSPGPQSRAQLEQVLNSAQAKSQKDVTLDNLREHGLQHSEQRRMSGDFLDRISEDGYYRISVRFGPSSGHALALVVRSEAGQQKFELFDPDHGLFCFDHADKLNAYLDRFAEKYDAHTSSYVVRVFTSASLSRSSSSNSLASSISSAAPDDVFWQQPTLQEAGAAKEAIKLPWQAELANDLAQVAQWVELGQLDQALNFLATRSKYSNDYALPSELAQMLINSPKSSSTQLLNRAFLQILQAAALQVQDEDSAARIARLLRSPDQGRLMLGKAPGYYRAVNESLQTQLANELQSLLQTLQSRASSKALDRSLDKMLNKTQKDYDPLPQSGQALAQPDLTKLRADLSHFSADLVHKTRLELQEKQSIQAKQQQQKLLANQVNQALKAFGLMVPSFMQDALLPHQLSLVTDRLASMHQQQAQNYQSVFNRERGTLGELATLEQQFSQTRQALQTELEQTHEPSARAELKRKLKLIDKQAQVFDGKDDSLRRSINREANQDNLKLERSTLDSLISTLFQQGIYVENPQQDQSELDALLKSREVAQLIEKAIEDNRAWADGSIMLDQAVKQATRKVVEHVMSSSYMQNKMQKIGECLKNRQISLPVDLAQPVQEQVSKLAKTEAEAQAQQEAQRAAEEQSKAQAEQEARRQTEQQTRRQLEQESRQQIENSARESARKEAEATARKQAEEAARHQAEQAAREQAETAATRVAEEQARKQAEQSLRDQVAKAMEDDIAKRLDDLKKFNQAQKEADLQRLDEKLANSELESRLKHVDSWVGQQSRTGLSEAKRTAVALDAQGKPHYLG